MLTASWIIVSRITGRAVAETWLPHVAAAINRDRYEVLTAYEYLVRFNHAVAREHATL